MSINVVTDFRDNATVRIMAYVYDDDAALADPTAITVTVIDPNGTTQVDGEAMTQSDTGIYYYYYHKGASEDAMAKGQWRGRVDVTDGTGDDAVISTGNFSFKVS